MHKEGRNVLFTHMRETASRHGIELLAINGVTDHIHILLRSDGKAPLSKMVRILKGESAHWANETLVFGDRLIWQKGYYSRSVAFHELRSVYSYIQNQEIRHGHS
jgi:putative transposase